MSRSRSPGRASRVAARGCARTTTKSLSDRVLPHLGLRNRQSGRPGPGPAQRFVVVRERSAAGRTGHAGAGRRRTGFHRWMKRTFATATAVALAVALAGCGEDSPDDPDDGTTATVTATTGGATTTAATETPSPTGTADGTGTGTGETAGDVAGAVAALQAAAGAVPDGQPFDMETESHQGQQVWEILVASGGQQHRSSSPWTAPRWSTSTKRPSPTTTCRRSRRPRSTPSRRCRRRRSRTAARCRRWRSTPPRTARSCGRSSPPGRRLDRRDAGGRHHR